MAVTVREISTVTVGKGPVELATRAMVRSMGILTPRQKLTAAVAVRVAANLDGEEDGSKASALSRELRHLTMILIPTAGSTSVEPAHLDPVAALRDEVARKRRERGQGA